MDVSEYWDRRIAAIRSYSSQLFDPSSHEPSTRLSQPDFLARIESIHSFYGTLIGKKMGEAFYLKGILEIDDLVEHFNKKDVGGRTSNV